MKKYNRMFSRTKENIKSILSYQESFEYLIHKMFMDPEWIEKYPRKKWVRILTYCMYYKFITKEHLQNTNRVLQGDSNSEQLILWRLEKKGYLSGEYAEVAGIKTHIYTITRQGISYCMKELKEMLVGRNKYDITDECLHYIGKRASGYINSISHAHSISIRDLNTYLYSCLPDWHYRFWIEASIDKHGHIYSFAERVSGNVVHSDGSLQSDAYIETPLSLTNRQLHFYVEQDMRTQGMKVIKGKIENYISCIYNNYSSEIGEHAILFTLVSRPTKVTYSKMDTASDKVKFCTATLSYIHVICFIIYALTDDTVSYYEVPMKEVLEELETYCREAPEAVGFYRNVISFLRSIMEENPELTAEDFLAIAKQGEYNRRYGMPDGFVSRHRAAYIRRRCTLQSAIVDSCSEIKGAMLSGLSVYTAHSRWLSTTFPYLMPPLLPEKEQRIRMAMTFYGYIKMDTPFVYETLSTNTGSYHLKNHYRFENGIHLYVENYSDDIGGQMRIKHYLQSVTWNGDNGILLCLIDADEIPSLRSIFMDSTYAKEMFATNVKIAFPLQVYFIEYDGLEKGRDMFDFDQEGNLHMKEI